MLPVVHSGLAWLGTFSGELMSRVCADAKLNISCNDLTKVVMSVQNLWHEGASEERRAPMLQLLHEELIRTSQNVLQHGKERCCRRI